jgi:hypothetical protein
MTTVTAKATKRSLEDISGTGGGVYSLEDINVMKIAS